jgi:hypothetical protein
MRMKWMTPPRWLGLAVVLLAAAGLSGCDDRVYYDRNPTVAVRKGMTWAWRPLGPPPASDRRVVSRDIMNGPDRQYRRDASWENDVTHNRIAGAIEVNLNSKGLRQVNDPAQADFLVDFQYGVERRRERVATPVYGGGLVCGYYGCWNGFWGPPGVVVHTVHYREGTIEFDMIERGHDRVAYRAWREKTVNNNSFRQEDINEGAKHLMKGLHPEN